jgi:hypothetical protein
MSLKRIAIDRTTLVEYMLPSAKQHMRVEFDRDDDFIKLVLARAIDFFERFTGFSVFAATYQWRPETSQLKPGVGVPIPVQPVSAWTILDNDGLDVTVDYRLIGQISPDVPGTCYLDVQQDDRWSFYGPGQYPHVATLQVGFLDIGLVPPGILDVVYRAAAFLYENRESAAIIRMDTAPYLNSIFTDYWIPRA